MSKYDFQVTFCLPYMICVLEQNGKYISPLHDIPCCVSESPVSFVVKLHMLKIAIIDICTNSHNKDDVLS